MENENANLGQFETTTCGRCGGSGEFPSARWQGKCLGCGGRGQKLTHRGAAALAFYNSLRTCKASSLAVGDTFTDTFGRKPRTIQAIEADYYNPNCIVFVCPGINYGVGKDSDVLRVLPADEDAEAKRKAFEYQDSLTAAGKPRKRAAK